jgi:1-deoxy-D-xylulose-5-phosphate synthase
VARACAEARVPTPVRSLGIPRAFLPHGSQQQLARDCGLDGPGIARAIVDQVGQ